MNYIDSNKSVRYIQWMFEDASFMEQDSKYTKKEHEMLSCILYHIPQFQKLLRANSRLCCVLFKYNYHLLTETQISYSKFEQNALHILLFIKHISNVLKDIDIINILSFIFFDEPNSKNRSGLMLYLLKKEINDKKKIFLEEIDVIFEKNIVTWRDALILIKRVNREQVGYLNRCAYDKQLDICRILVNDLVTCANLSCSKRWYRSKYGFMILPAERDMLIKQNKAQDGSNNGIDVFEIILNRWIIKKEQIQNKWYKCKKCKLFYCSKRCQKYDWKRHNHRRMCNNLLYICHNYK